MSPLLSRAGRIAVPLLIGLAALAIRLVVFNAELSEGSNWYWFIGARIATGDIMTIFTYDEGVFYVALLALLELLFGPENLLLAKSVTLVSSVGAVVLLYLLGREVTSTFAALSAALLMCLSLLDICFASTIQYNILYIFLTLAALYAMALGWRRGERRLMVVAGVLSSLVILTRISGIIIPCATLWLGFRTWRRDGWGSDAMRLWRRYWLVCGTGFVLFLLLSIPVFRSAGEYLAYRQINQQSMWAALAAGDSGPLLAVFRDTVRNAMLAILNLDAPYSIQTSWLYRSFDLNRIADTPFWQGAAIALALGAACFVRFSPVYLYFVAHTAAFTFYEADLRYTLFGLGLLLLFMVFTAEQVLLKVLRLRVLAWIGPGIAVGLLMVGRWGAFGDYRRYVGDESFLRDKYDQISMAGYIACDAWLTENETGAAPMRVLCPVVMVDFCSVATCGATFFDVDYTQPYSRDRLLDRLLDTAATHLILQRIDDIEELDSVVMKYLDRAPFEEKLINGANINSLLTSLILRQGELGPATLMHRGQTISLEPLAELVHRNIFFDLHERMVVVAVTQAKSEPSDAIECIYDCCFEFQLP